MKKPVLIFATLALVAACTQPPRCSRDGRSAEYWDRPLKNAEGLVRFDAIDGTEGVVSFMEDAYKKWKRDPGPFGAENVDAYMRLVAIGLMEIADGKCGGTPSQQRTARKILDRLRIKLGFG